MVRFTLSLAGTAIGVSAIYPSTRDFCAGYLTEEEPSFCVEITQEDIDAEREMISGSRGTANPPPDRSLEMVALHRKLSGPLLERDTSSFTAAPWQRTDAPISLPRLPVRERQRTRGSGWKIYRGHTS